MLDIQKLLLNQGKLKKIRILAIKKRRKRYKVLRLKKKLNIRNLKKKRLKLIHSRYILNKMIKFFIKKGKRVKSFRFFFYSFLRIRLITRLSPVYFFFYSLKNLKPFLKVIKVRKAGKVYDVPAPLSKKKQFFLILKWLSDIFKTTKKRNFKTFLSNEILNICYKRGDVIKNKKKLIKKVFENRSVMHFRWY